MAPPEVSVLMPAYNAAPYIGEAIESCLAQTMEDFELIVVDDGSTDATCRIVEDFGDSRLKLRRFATNRGLAIARNHALDVATGSWVALLDADDLWDRSRLELLHAVASRHGSRTVVYDRMQRFVVDRAGRHRRLESSGRRKHQELTVEVVDPVEFVRRRLAGFPVFSRSLARDTGARHPPGVRAGSDTAFQVQLLNAEGVEVRRVHLGLVHYRVHPGTATGMKGRLGEVRRAYEFLLNECDLRSDMREAVEHRLALHEQEVAFDNLKAAVTEAEWGRAAEIVRADPSVVLDVGRRSMRSLRYRATIKLLGSEGRG